MARVAVEVNKQALKAAIAEAEENGPLRTQSILWEKVAEIYNRMVPNRKPISASVVYLRVREWKINVRTSPRASVEVNKHVLKTAIAQAEKDGPLQNRSVLWEKVTEIYNGLVTEDKTISPSVTQLRVKEWGIEVKTPKGKRGGGNGEGLAKARAEGRRRVPKAEKFASNEAIQQSLEEIEKSTPETFRYLVEKMRNGSQSAGLKLKCLECSGWVSKDVRFCPVTACGLWPFRPYQRATDTDNNEADTDNLEEMDAEESVEAA